MTIRLKERLLEEKLNRFSDGCFSKRLNIAHTFKDIKSKRLYEVRFPLYLEGEKIHVNIIFEESDVEEVPEYDPNSWNKWPEVTPPYNVMMRLKMKDGHLRVGYFKEFSDGGHWATQDGIEQILWMGLWNGEGNPVEFFRPWED